MKISMIVVSAAMVVAGILNVTSAAASPGPLTSTTTWSSASVGGAPLPVMSPTVRSARLVYAAPQPGVARMTVSPARVESYIYWVVGVTVTAVGFTPGEAVVVTDTAPTGRVLTFETVTAGADGGFSHVYKTETIGAPVGRHQLLAIGQASRRTAAASLAVTANSDQRLRVSVTPAVITQDQFVRKPVTVLAQGLAPNQRLFLNLFAPDGSGQAVAGDQALRADATGTFRYPIQSVSAAVPVGEWGASVVADNGFYGSATYRVTPGAPRTTVGLISFRSPRVTAASLAANGLLYRLSELKPFDAIDLALTTPLGLTVPLGVLRVNGVGSYAGRLTASSNPGLGTYRLVLTSRSTGDTAAGSFIVTDADGHYPPNAAVVARPASITVDAASTAGRGFVVALTHAPAGSFFSVSVVAPDLHFPYLRDGKTDAGATTLFGTVGSDGSASARVVFTRPQPVGRYLVEVFFEQGRLVVPVRIVSG